jgi:hypothetical protein
MQVCQMEHQLFEHFFPGTVADGAPGLEVLMNPLCTVRAAALLMPSDAEPPMHWSASSMPSHHPCPSE